ncbi:aldo/keto reductase [Oceanobacillus sp. FSL H7-0719]|uniref:aldo/keto reductase n=1 Tax=Oceanobacillus sp. FSL H7-0719 TaxID=2954507 RepID=UPI003253FFFE
MINHLQDKVILNNGIKIPGFGLGVFKVEAGATTYDTVRTALKLGYRLIDTAAIYGNEEAVGKAIHDSGIPREEIFVTSKVWNDDQGYEETLAAFDTTMEKLGLEYLDLYLIHWPITGKFKDTWRALEKIYRDGKVRSIGVSNFHVHHLEELLKDAEVKPVLNQIEYHPHLTQEDVLQFCKENAIQMQSWSPLKRGEIITEPVIKEIADKHGKTPAQIVLRWNLQNGVITIPKSVKEHRMQENADIFNFELTEDEMEKLNDLNKNERIGSNPDDF